ncbi:hypothetical protein T459_13445 [Capsicum annuum]|uniref:Glyoxal oxidase N-terminal domain-containing protein n=1 Tax=Capsicum annuum TaxID=4072 RepID=A0A2G2ZSP7_CAPAN|nr:hypothetical protein T459_13445 [Capsicum annuum]
MGITNPKDDVVISGRYPNYFTSNGQSIFGKTPIWNDDSLSLFLRTVEIFCNRLNLQTLDKYACVEHSPIVEEPTDKIVNNDDDVQGELDSDEPSQYESSDDDQSSDDDDDDNNNDENINGESTSVGVYTDNHSSIAIPYLDHTEESPEELRCMVNEDYFRTPLWNQNNSEHIKSDKYKEDHYNLNNDLIATSLIPYIRKDPNINIKMVRENIKGLHHYTPSYRKAQKGRRKTFKMVYGDFESSFKALPAYMTTLQSFNPGTVVEWEHDSTTMQDFGRSNLSLPRGRCRYDPNDMVSCEDCYSHSVLYGIGSNTFRALMLQTDPWCSSGAVLPDGTLVQIGGYNDGDRVIHTPAPYTGENCDWVELTRTLIQ